MVKPLLSILLVFFCSVFGFAQTDLSNLRVKYFDRADLPLPLDSLTVVPESMTVWEKDNQVVDPIFYTLEQNIFYWKGAPGGDSLRIQYRVLPFQLDKRYSHLDTTQIEIAGDGTYIGFDYNPYEEKEGLVDFQGLDYNGSFSRGISFGNNQNLVLNSSFNLQLAGKLGNDVEILAAISDNNIPLQPEGNTQQLQEFDKIFIQLKRRNTSLTAGDYELARPNSHFMNYFKKLQGATFNNLSTFSNNHTLNTTASIAIARGKFARNTLQQIEGNQGPYQLRGNEGERFIIVLAGTEKVYLDGQILRRGLEEDYTIDYNQSEVIFTNKRLITKDSRIIVEFEYADQSYLRSLYAFNTEYTTDRWRLYFNVYSEQDAKNSGGARDLDSLDRAILQIAGNDLSSTFAPGLDTLEAFNEFRIAYKQRDSTYLISNLPVTQSIFIYTTNADSAEFSVNFLEVDAGRGDYIIDASTGANGRVYRWVAPDPITGEPQGNYTPGKKLIAPNQRQLFTLGGEYKLSEKSSLLTEVALSHNDPNRFSTLGNDENVGMAVFTHYHQENEVGKKESGWRLLTDVNYEYLQENFKALNPYRNAEFTRDWNISNSNNQVTDLQKASEHLGSGGFTLVKKDYGSVAYQFGGYIRQGVYTGTRHFAQATFKRKGYDLNVQSSLLASDGAKERSRYLRPSLNFSKTFQQLGNWKVGIYGEQEKNERFSNDSDTLNFNSIYYNLYRVYIQNPQEGPINIGANYTQRYDYAPQQRQFAQNTIADEFNLNGNWQQGKASRLGWNLTYRQLEIVDTTLTKLDPQETFLGRVEHNLNLWRGVLRSSTNYQIGSGQERKLEYQYLPVQPGEGVYTWVNDLNGDSIPQINEIEEAVFQNEANIVRVSLFTDEFIRTNDVQLNQSLRLDPRTLWYNKKGPLKFLSRLSTQSTLRITRKTQQSDDIAAWNPFQLSIADTSLVSIASGIRNTLFFNRSNPKYDLQIGQFDNRNKVVLTSGFESRSNEEQFFRARWNISQKISGIASVAQGRKENDSEFFNNRDYSIQFYRVEPQLTFLLSKNFRSIFTYQFRTSKNTLPEGGETATNHDFKLDLTYNQSSQTSIRMNLSFVKVRYDGSINSSLEFAMLEGLRDGDNYLWNLVLDRRLAKNIQLNISYEGRKTGENAVVHIGRAQVRATF